jgi:hypothetical protein
VPTTTTESGSNVDDTPTWVWVLLGVLALGVVVLLVVVLFAPRWRWRRWGWRSLCRGASASPRRCRRQLGRAGLGSREPDGRLPRASAWRRPHAPQRRPGWACEYEANAGSPQGVSSRRE